MNFKPHDNNTGAFVLKLCFATWLLFGAFLVLVEVSDGSTCDTSDEERFSLNENALKNIQISSNFHVLTGKLHFNKGAIGNPNGKYGILDFPPAARPLGFNIYCKYVGRKLHKIVIDKEQQICNAMFALGPRDAVVWLGCTPPESEYFSLAVFLGLRFKPKMWEPFAQFGDAINHLVVNTTSNDSNPFCKTALFVATGDADTFNHIRDSYVSVGLSEKAINVYPIPSDLVEYKHGIWYFSKYDLFSWQFRVNGAKQKDAADEYFKTPQTVYLLQSAHRMFFPFEFGHLPKPLPNPPLRTREDGLSEYTVYSQALGELIAEIQRHFVTDGYQLVYSFELEHKTPNIIRCMVDPEYSPVLPPLAKKLYNMSWAGCDWFTRDALYSFTPDEAPMEFSVMKSSRVFVLVGLNQVMLQKCTHYNFLFSSGIHGQFESSGHSFYISNHDADGSATKYGREIRHVDKMIVWKFARPGFCSIKDKWCTQITEEQISGLAYIAERKYLNPSTKVGASPCEVIPSTVLVFDMNTKELDFDLTLTEM